MQMWYGLLALALLAIGAARSEDRLDDMNDEDHETITYSNDLDISIPSGENVSVTNKGNHNVRLSWPLSAASSNGTFNLTIHETPATDIGDAENTTTNSTRYPMGQGIPFPVGLSLRIRPGTALVKLLTDGANLTAITDIDGWMSLDKDASLISNSAVESGPVNDTGYAVVKAYPVPNGAVVPIMGGTTLLTVLSNDTVLETGHGWHPDMPDVIQHGAGQSLMQLLAQLGGHSSQGSMPRYLAPLQ